VRTILQWNGMSCGVIESNRLANVHPMKPCVAFYLLTIEILIYTNEFSVSKHAVAAMTRIA
jgi:hypothetical protein